MPSLLAGGWLLSEWDFYALDYRVPRSIGPWGIWALSAIYLGACALMAHRSPGIASLRALVMFVVFRDGEI